ncbi:hypothetical protein O181_029883 [Austropuccinia psidii MF-1]|uniref:Uncharacterized protein n=1 Tax=Austropuccinia psidii MF-1 TaxID=1389203 RepID=A0A9Q3CWM0_9BASI|nr:hypothetical protein [Austropuccinia psidii MF-1]
MDGLHYHAKKIKKDNGILPKKRKVRKVEAPVASTSNTQVNQTPKEGKNKNKRNWKKPYSPNYRMSRIEKDFMDNVFNMSRTLMEFKDKEKQRMRQPSLAIKTSLSPDVVGTLTDIQNSILPLNFIKSGLLSLSQIFVQIKKEIDKIKFMVENNIPKTLI